MKSTLLPYKASLELHTFTSYRLGLSHMITCSRPPKPPVCPILSAVTYGSLFPIGLLACNRSNAIWLPSHCPRNTALSMFSNGFMLLNARDTSLSLPYLSPEQHLTQLTGFSILGTGILTPLFSSGLQAVSQCSFLPPIRSHSLGPTKPSLLHLPFLPLSVLSAYSLYHRNAPQNAPSPQTFLLCS